MLTLKGRTAIVTGAAGIVGYEIVTNFLKEGMNVVTLHSRQEKADLAAEKLKEFKDHVLPLSADFSEVLEKTNERFGGLDVLVIAHGWPPLNQGVDEITEDYWQSVVSSNMTSGFFMMQKALPYLQKSVAPRIIFLTSAEAHTGGLYDGLAYTAAKGGVISLVYSMARRFAKHGITVNTVAMGGIYNKPFPIGDKEHDESLPEHNEMLVDIPLGRLGNPADIAAAVCYLASEEAGFVTGELLNVSGGLVIG